MFMQHDFPVMDVELDFVFNNFWVHLKLLFLLTL